MATFERFEDMLVWRQSRELSRKLYRCTGQASFRKDYSLQHQIRRAGVSVMANIAEGFERDGIPEFIQFLSLAKGSAGEIRSHLYAALDAEFISREEFDQLSRLSSDVSVKISHLMSYLKTSGYHGRKFP